MGQLEREHFLGLGKSSVFLWPRIALTGSVHSLCDRRRRKAHWNARPFERCIAHTFVRWHQRVAPSVGIPMERARWYYLHRRANTLLKRQWHGNGAQLQTVVFILEFHIIWWLGVILGNENVYNM